MSTLSGVFPNAITPTFAPSQDPAQQSRLRRENEQAAFSPVDELEANSASRRTAISQPGRLEAELANAAANPQSSQTTPTVSKESAEPTIEATQAATPRPERETPDVAERTRTEGQDEAQLERQQQLSEQQQAREEAKLKQEIELVQELAARDREVRAHEQAHQAVGGQYAGAMEFTFKQGPDGKRYAVGGEVGIDVSKVSGNPEATLAKAEQVRRAALAPAEPSTQDRQVAALATQMALEAQTEIRQIERQEAEKASEERAEQRELSQEDEQKTEANSKEDSAKSERVAEDSEERLQEILQKTSEAVETALDAAYRTQPQKEVGFNLDTIV